MTTVFKNARLALTTSLADIYTCPAGTSAIVTLLHVANVDGANDADVSVVWTDSSDSDAVTYLAKTINVPADASFNTIEGKLVLEAGDKIRGLASADGDLELSMSVMEMS